METAISKMDSEFMESKYKMMETEEMQGMSIKYFSPFDKIPREIICMIFSSLKLNDIGSVSTVCKDWNTLCWSFVRKFSIASKNQGQWQCLKKMIRLQTLEIETNKQEIHEAVSELTSLRKLCIQNAYYVRNEELQHLSKLTQLKYLSLSCGYSHLKLDFLESMTHLEKICISRTKVTDAGIDTLCNLTSLQHIYLYRTDITDEGLEKLSKLPNLNTLDIACNSHITDIGVGSLNKMTSLRHVDIGDTRISSGGMESLRTTNPNLHIGLLPLYPLGRRTKRLKLYS